MKRDLKRLDNGQFCFTLTFDKTEKILFEGKPVGQLKYTSSGKDVDVLLNTMVQDLGKNLSYEPLIYNPNNLLIESQARYAISSYISNVRLEVDLFKFAEKKKIQEQLPHCNCCGQEIDKSPIEDKWNVGYICEKCNEAEYA